MWEEKFKRGAPVAAWTQLCVLLLGPKNMSSQGPKNMSSQGPKNMSSQGPKNMSSQGPKNMSSQGPKNMSSQSPKKCVFPFVKQCFLTPELWVSARGRVREEEFNRGALVAAWTQLCVLLLGPKNMSS